MTESLHTSPRRSLFWLLWWRSISVKRPQALLAVGSMLIGAAVGSMLLNLYRDVQRKMTQEFRAYGVNVVLAPAAVPAGAPAELMDESVMRAVEAKARQNPEMLALPVLNAVVRLKRTPADPRLPEFENAVAVGTDLAALGRMNPGWRSEETETASFGQLSACALGARLAARLKVRPGDTVQLEPLSRDIPSQGQGGPTCAVARVFTTGSAEDDQVFLPLADLQNFLGMPGKLSLVELSVPGETAAVESAIRELAAALPGVEVRPIRQIVYSAGKVLSTIRWLLLSLSALILVIIAICVLVTMTAIVLERRKDIGVMKALGADNRQVIRLLLAEGTGLGVAGGAAGFWVGILLAQGVARRLFGVTLHPLWWSLPFACFLMALLAIAAVMFTVGMVRAVEPAIVLRGE